MFCSLFVVLFWPDSYLVAAIALKHPIEDPFSIRPPLQTTRLTENPKAEANSYKLEKPSKLYIKHQQSTQLLSADSVKVSSPNKTEQPIIA